MSAGIRAMFPPGRFRVVKNVTEQKVVATLPRPYRHFYAEWKDSEDKETPVHWTPREDKWERNPLTGQVTKIQNEPIPVLYPVEMHSGLWGGEGVVQGLVKKGKYRSPVPRFWVPLLKKTVVYSQVLDKYFSAVVTDNALKLIDTHAGLDSYLLKTPAYDLKTLLALKLKRQILLALADKDFSKDNPEKQVRLLEKYKEFILPREEADWYGLSVDEAKTKYEAWIREQNKPIALKQQLRLDLLEELKDAPPTVDKSTEMKVPWTVRLNPFSKPKAVQ